MVRVKCPQCATLVAAAPEGTLECPNCGYSGPVAGAMTAAPDAANVPPPAATPPGPKPPTTGVAVAALLLNVLLLPGLGTIIGGRTREGIYQLVLVGVGILTAILLVGFAIILGAWIWGLVSGVQFLQTAKEAPLP